MTKAYSLRIDPHLDLVERELSITLDALDSDESGLLQSDQWLREAARRRIISDQEIKIIESSQAFQEATLLQVVDSRENILDVLPELNELDPIENSLKIYLTELDNVERNKWIREAIIMRYAIEDNAFQFFVNHQRSKKTNEPTITPQIDSVVDQPSQIESLKIDVRHPETIEHDDLTPYREALGVMLEQFYA